MALYERQHGERITKDGLHGKQVLIWMQPVATLPGKWLTPEQWDNVHNGTTQAPAPAPAEAAPQTGATVKGYRTLCQVELDLMNELKATSAQFLEQMATIEKGIALAYAAAKSTGNTEELARLDDACPRKWTAKAITAMQEACMYGCRSVAQPSGKS